MHRGSELTHWHIPQRAGANQWQRGQIDSEGEGEEEEEEVQMAMGKHTLYRDSALEAECREAIDRSRLSPVVVRAAKLRLRFRSTLDHRLGGRLELFRDMHDRPDMHDAVHARRQTTIER